MNPNRSTPPVLPALVAAVAGLALVTTALRAQSAPAADPATLAKYDANHNGVLDPDEIETMNKADNAASTTSTGSVDEVLQLSPFQVDASKDKGYFAENTLAGSRIKTNLSDLASAITVVTKQQMEDTASVDINDVFKYEANTEGSSSYTPSIVNRNTFKDSVAGYSLGDDGTTTTNAQSNRLRGLGAPDAAINNYSTNNRIPFDAYNIQSIEISRGPNSLLFGLGSPAGVVNTNAAQAGLTRDTNTVQTRIDHNGSYRVSLGINRVLVKDKLAVYGAMLYDNRQFERKPSRDLYRRQYGAITFHPFKNTFIRAFAENYQNDANRPNSITPRDQVTPWLQSGRPVYDPLTRMVTVQDTGRVYGPYVSSSLSPGYIATLNTITGVNGLSATTSPLYVPGIAFDDVARPLRRIDNGNVVDLMARQFQFYSLAQTSPATTAPTASSLGWTANNPNYLYLDRFWSASANTQAPTFVKDGKTYTYNVWNYAGVNNKSIYDWTKYNTLQSNFAQVKASNYNLEFEHEISKSLFFSMGWLRQDIDEVDNYSMGQLTGATLGVDTNKYTPDGRVNTYYGLPFMYEGAGGGVDTFYNPETDDNFRAMLAYKLDFTTNRNWTRWLGRHNLIGTIQEQDVMRATERYRMNFVGIDPDGKLRYTPNTALSGTALWSGTVTTRHYYMASPGDAQNGSVTHSTGFYGNQGWQSQANSSIKVWNYQTGQYVDEAIGERTFFADNGSYKNQREVKGGQVALQSYLWDDRLVTTLGWRTDRYRARKTTTGIISTADGTQVEASLPTSRLFANGYSGEINQDVVMNRWNRWDKMDGSTKTLGVAFRPFSRNSYVHKWAGENSIVTEFLDGLTFYYNQSDNFNPPATFQTDYFMKPLPKPTGKGKDGGLGFSLFNNKIVARVNWYTTENTNERTTAASTLLTRAAYGDTTLGLAWASAVLRIRKAVAAGKTLNQDKTDPNSVFYQSTWNSNTAWDISSDADQHTLYSMLNLPFQYYAGVSPGATQNSKAHGVELQLTYNPTSNWTVKITGSKSEATYSNIAPQYDAWVNYRMPTWTTMAAADIPDFTDPNTSRKWSLSNFWNAYGYSSTTYFENTDGNTSSKNYFNNTVVAQVAGAKALEGAVSPSQRMYHASLLTNYTFTPDQFGGKLKGWSVGGSERWESRAAIGYYGKVRDPDINATLINYNDTTRPIWGDNGNYYTDLWLAYSRKIFHNRIGMKVQLNCNNALESGRLVPVAANWDGTPWAFRIIDPRQWIVQTTFNF